MAIDGVSATTSTAATTQNVKVKSPNDDIGQDAFMLLLLEQLKNQDPLKPMDDTQFMAQMAQFNSLTQLTEINATLGELMTAQTLSQGSAMIGQTVSGMSNTSQLITGVVSGLQITGGKITLEVDGNQMPLESVRTVTQTPDPETETNDG